MFRSPSRHLVTTALALGVMLATLTGCSDSSPTETAEPTSEETTSTTEPSAYPLDGELRLNHIQALGSHNSYHLEPEPALLEGIRGFSPPLADSFEYTHLPLAEQFSEHGIRQIELDVFADPEGGLFVERVIPPLVGLPAQSDDPAMAEPGFKVFHVQDVDFGSTCATLVACLEEVKAWSDANPGHVPMMILIEAKDDPIDIGADLGFTVPITIGAAELDALDAEIRSVFDEEQLISPEDVQAGHDTLEDAILTDGWPTLGATRGKVMFALDNEDDVRDAYLDGHPSLSGRAMFASGEPGDSWAAFIKLNDPLEDGDRITDMVEAGYVVRTRSDGDTAEARSGETAQRDAALASGAQWVSTDYYLPDPDFDTGFVVGIPDGTPARCNPLIAPPDCTPEDIENPAALTSG